VSGDKEKTSKRMSCWNCPRYDRTVRQCREGKANPRRKSDSIIVAEILGVRALCHYNPYRDTLAMRMYFPTAAATMRATAKSRRRARRGLWFAVREVGPGTTGDDLSPPEGK
jgi:hypothetical protein